MDNCPICDTKLTKDYCTNCGWEIFTYLGEMSKEEKDRYDDRYRICKEVYKKKPTNKKTKSCIKSILTVIIIMFVVGGGLYWQNQKLKQIEKYRLKQIEKYRLKQIEKYRLKQIEIYRLEQNEIYNWKKQEIVTIDNLTWQNIDYSKEKTYEWQETVNYCKASTLGGYDNWRLPTKDELKTLLTKTKNSKENPHYIRKEFVENMSYYALFWTSTAYKNHITQAWVVNFNDGYDNWDNKANSYFVRCVR